MFPGSGQLPFSAATKADGLIYVSGALAAKGDIKEQTKGVLDSLGQSLTKAGSSLQNVVAATVYLKNAADAAAMTEVWRADLAEGRADAHDRRRRTRRRRARSSRSR